MNTSNRFKSVFRVSLFALVLLTSLFFGCQKEELPPSAQQVLNQTLARVDQAQLAIDIKIIEDSLNRWGLSGVTLAEPNGVRYKIDSLGNEFTPVLENFIVLNYSGRFLSTGEEFDSAQNANFFLANLISGFQTTLPLIPVGSKFTLYIPSGLAYGPDDRTDNDGNVTIPGNANLIFDIEMVAAY